MAHESLGVYLKRRYGHETCGGDSEEFVSFLEQSVVTERGSAVRHDLHGRYEFHDAVDAILAHLVNSNSRNVLRKGYINESGRTHGSDVNFLVTALKSRAWHTVFVRIGQANFVDLVLNTNCFVKVASGYVQVFGEVPGFQNHAAVALARSRMLYRMGRTPHNHLRMLLDDANEIVGQIVGHSGIPRKAYGQLKRLLEVCVRNDRKIAYGSLFHLMVIEHSPPATDNFEWATPVNLVIQYVFTVIGKTFPLSVWGSNKNKCRILKHLAKFITNGKYDRLMVHTVLKNILVTEIRWLGKPAVTSPQDLVKRTAMLGAFVQWLFERYTCGAIAKVWHVTEATNSTGLLFYPHSVWRQLTLAWLLSYIERYLFETKRDGSTAHFEKFNYGDLRLVPKKNDFRVLCVPIKRPFLVDDITKEQVFAYKKEYDTFKKNVVLPVLQLIHDKNKRAVQRHPRCYSVLDILARIMRFKAQLLQKHETLPKLYMVKLDMKHCFDNLNQGKIMECFERLLEGDDNDTTYYIRQVAECADFAQINRKMRSVIRDQKLLSQLSLFNQDVSKVMVDMCWTKQLSKSQILDVLKGQVLHSTIRIGNKLYKRAQGVFQGFALLATFCDIVYNALVDDSLGFLLGGESLLVRLVDDFLFISTNEEDCKKVYKTLASEVAHQYGAFVNEEKSVWVNDGAPDTITFVGLTINCHNLEVQRNHDTAAKVTMSCKSFKAAYHSMERSMRLRLQPSLVDLELLSPQTAMTNYELVLRSVFEAFYTDFGKIAANDTFEPTEFAVFAMSVLEYCMATFHKANGTISFVDDIILTFHSTLEGCLAKRKHFSQPLALLRCL